MEDVCNVRLSGIIEKEAVKAFSVPVYSMYETEIRVERHSGEFDIIKLNVKEDSVGAVNALIGKNVCVDGELRTYKRNDGCSETCLLVHSIVESDEKVNYAKIVGLPVKLRSTANGKGIPVCEARVEIKGKYDKMSRVTAVGWGGIARVLEGVHEGEKILAEGRVQSRQMKGNGGNGPKTVEITIKHLEVLKNGEEDSVETQ